MMSSRGMGDINPSKMPGKKIIKRKDDPNDVAMYKKGGHVNAAGKQFVAQPKTIAKKTAGFR
jgi:hypothetical protein